MPLAFGLGCAELRGGFRGSTGVAAGQCVGLRFATGIGVAVGLNAMVPHLRDFVLTALCNEIAGVRPARFFNASASICATSPDDTSDPAPRWSASSMRTTG
jgi:hypothetical protein